jgi:hypothetical protein
MSGTHNKGKKRGPQHVWTEEQDEFLRLHAGTRIAREIAEELGVSKIQVQVRCNALGIEWRVKGAMERAAKQGEKFFLSPLPCARGHLSPRWTSNGCCVECDRLRDNGVYKQHYKSRRREATPVDLSLEQKREIWAIYRECRRISKETGVPHEVDHIFPLAKGGRHIASNLQIITAEENRRKSARLPCG